jgi:antirestriction protein ArdC
LKRFTVFNIAQCEGLRDGLFADAEPLPEREIVPVAEEVIAASGIPFRIGGAKAFYAPSQDYVQVPPQPAFFEQVNYYRTALHELCHGSGHSSRLDRKIMNPFGSKDYAREELVAEMGSAFLCAALGIVPTVRHADYLGSWLEVLREDNRAIFAPPARPAGPPIGCSRVMPNTRRGRAEARLMHRGRRGRAAA